MPLFVQINMKQLILIAATFVLTKSIIALLAIIQVCLFCFIKDGTHYDIRPGPNFIIMFKV